MIHDELLAEDLTQRKARTIRDIANGFKIKLYKCFSHWGTPILLTDVDVTMVWEAIEEVEKNKEI